MMWFQHQLLLWIVLGCTFCDLFAQEILPFRYQVANNVDVTSFHGMMVLSYELPNKFIKLPKNPVFSPSKNGWDRNDVSDPFIVQNSDSLILFYAGSGEDGSRYRIGRAIRDEMGWYWTNRTKINLAVDDWDGFHQLSPIVYRDSLHWRMIFFGNYRDEELGYGIGQAVSIDLQNWQKLSRQPLQLDTLLNWAVSGQIYGDIVYLPNENKYRLYFSGFQGPLSAIGFLESTNGVNWQIVTAQPIISLLPGVIAPEVVYDGKKYRMYFSRLTLSERGISTELQQALSKDGITWDSIKTVLKPSERWEKNTLVRPHLVYMENRMMLYYAAGKGRWKIGAAVTKPKFSKKGYWRSQKIIKSVSGIELGCQIPEGTAIDLIVKWENNSEEMVLLPETIQLTKRYGGKKVIFRNPKADAIIEWIALKLKTTDEAISPVVYEIKLLP